MTAIFGVIRAFFRLVGLIFFAIGAISLGFLVAVLAAGNGLASQALGQVWFQNDPFSAYVNTASLPLFGAIIERRIHPKLWDPVFLTILGWPSWLALLVLAIVFLGISVIIFSLARRRARSVA